MGFFNFLKKIFDESANKNVETIQRENVNFSDITKIVEKKSNKVKARDAEVVLIIKNKIVNFTEELKEKIKLANAVEIESKDKNDKIKSAVYEGRKKYIEFLERFMESLENIEANSPLEKAVESINLAFTRFNESSGKIYERATILIGKEMGSIRESLKVFSNEIVSIFKENENLLSNSKSLSVIKLKMEEYEKTKEEIKKADVEISDLTNKILKKGEEVKEISKKMENLKKSSEYLENLEKEKLIQDKEKEVEKEISDLKQLIDFKALSNFFHIFEDKMILVKSYRDNFAEEFKRDSEGNNLLKLLNESKLNTAQISNAIKLILSKEEEIKKDKSGIKEDEIKPFMTEIEKLNEKSQGFINEMGWVEKKKEKIKLNQEEIYKLIKEELSSIGVDLKDN